MAVDLASFIGTWPINPYNDYATAVKLSGRSLYKTRHFKHLKDQQQWQGASCCPEKEALGLN
jgi:hypothetical protein